MRTPHERLRATTRVLDDVRAERERQDAKWGEQNHPDGTGPLRVWSFTGPASWVRACARMSTEQMAAEGDVTYLDILLEEVAEAFAEDDPGRLRAELVQVAAVAVQWIEAIDRRCVVHACPEDGESVMPCCGRTPFEVPPGDRIYLTGPGGVTCKGAGA